MIAIKLTKYFTVTTTGSDLDAHSDVVMDELLALEECTKNISNADVSAALTEGTIEISVTATGEDFDNAVALADSTIRAAIHASGGHTPEWVIPTLSPTSQHAELVDA